MSSAGDVTHGPGGKSRAPSAGPLFFPTPADLRAWFEANHDQAGELWLGLYKKGTGLPTVTIPEAIDEALCFGWIDGLKRSVDEKSYKLRFTPRRKRSSWSARNLGRMEELIAAGRVTEAGLAAYLAPKGGRRGTACRYVPQRDS